MAKFCNLFATVFIENGFQKVMLPDGTVIPHLVKTVTECDVNKAEVTFTVLCNNVATKEDAIAAYSESRSSQADR